MTTATAYEQIQQFLNAGTVPEDALAPAPVSPEWQEALDWMYEHGIVDRPRPEPAPELHTDRQPPDSPAKKEGVTRWLQSMATNALTSMLTDPETKPPYIQWIIDRAKRDAHEHVPDSDAFVMERFVRSFTSLDSRFYDEHRLQELYARYRDAYTRLGDLLRMEEDVARINLRRDPPAESELPVWADVAKELTHDQPRAGFWSAFARSLGRGLMDVADTLTFGEEPADPKEAVAAREALDMRYQILEQERPHMGPLEWAAHRAAEQIPMALGAGAVAAGTSALTGGAALPAWLVKLAPRLAGGGFWLTNIYGQELHGLRAGGMKDDRAAKLIAGASAVVQSAIETINLFPWLEMTGIRAPTLRGLARNMLKRGGSQFATESLGEEGLQGLASWALQGLGLAMDDQAPGYDWTGQLMKAAQNVYEGIGPIALMMAPGFLIGGAGAMGQHRRGTFLKKALAGPKEDPATIEAADAFTLWNPDLARRIVQGPAPSLQKLAKAGWGRATAPQPRVPTRKQMEPAWGPTVASSSGERLRVRENLRGAVARYDNLLRDQREAEGRSLLEQMQNALIEQLGPVDEPSAAGEARTTVGRFSQALEANLVAEGRYRSAEEIRDLAGEAVQPQQIAPAHEAAVHRALARPGASREEFDSAKAMRDSAVAAVLQESELPYAHLSPEADVRQGRVSPPVHVAYLAAQAARIRSGERVVDPFARTGAMAAQAVAAGASVQANERDRQLADTMTGMPGATITTMPVGTMIAQGQRTPVILTTTSLTKASVPRNAERHPVMQQIDQAMRLLRENGRAVFLMPIQASPLGNTNARAWWDSMRREFRIGFVLPVSRYAWRTRGGPRETVLLGMARLGPTRDRDFRRIIQNYHDLRPDVADVKDQAQAATVLANAIADERYFREMKPPAPQPAPSPVQEAVPAEVPAQPEAAVAVPAAEIQERAAEAVEAAAAPPRIPEPPTETGAGATGEGPIGRRVRAPGAKPAVRAVRPRTPRKPRAARPGAAQASVAVAPVVPAAPAGQVQLPTGFLPASQEPVEGNRPIPFYDVVRTFARLFDIPIVQGPIRAKQIGAYYYAMQRFVKLRSSYASSVGVAAHEVAHHLDHTEGIIVRARKDDSAALRAVSLLDYVPDRQDPHEGFAEYIRLLLTTESAPLLAPEFHRWFVNKWLPAHSRIAAKLESAKRLVNRAREQGLVEAAKGRIVMTKKLGKPVGVSAWDWVKENLVDLAARFYANWADPAHFAWRHLEEVRKYAPHRYQASLGHYGITPYDRILAWNRIDTIQGLQALTNGVFDISRGGVHEKLGDGIKDIFQSFKTWSDFIDFNLFLVATHAKENWARGRNPGIEEAEADAVLRKYSTPEWQKYARRITAFNNSLLDLLVQVGKIPATKAQIIKNFWQTFVPLWRVDANQAMQGLRAARGSGTMAPVGRTLARRSKEGSGLPVYAPLLATMERAFLVHRTATQHVVWDQLLSLPGAGRYVRPASPTTVKTLVSMEEIRKDLVEFLGPEILELAEQQGLDKEAWAETLISIFRPIRQDRSGQSIYSFTKGDTTVHRWVHPELVKAVNSMNPEQMGWFMRLMGTFTRMRKLGWTGLSTRFAGRNPFRDYGEYLLNAREPFMTTAQRKTAWAKLMKKARGLVSPWEYMGAYIWSRWEWLTADTQPAFFDLWDFSGVSQSTFLGVDQHSMRRAVDFLRASGPAGKLWLESRHPVEAARALLNVTEVGPRLAAFSAVLERYGWDRKRINSGEPVPNDLLIKATVAGMDITVNFKKQGHHARYMNQVSAFFTATVGGTDKMFRRMKEDPEAVAIRLLAAAAAQLAYWWSRKDDDDYREQPAWMKALFWTISDGDGNTVAWLPKPPSWGPLTLSAIEAIADAFYRADPSIGKEAGVEAFKNLLPVRMNVPGLEFAEAVADFDIENLRPIVSGSVRHLEPPDQFNMGTPEYLKAISEWLAGPRDEKGERHGFMISPAKLDHILTEVTGGMSHRWAGPIDQLLRDEKFDASDVPIVGAFLPGRRHTRSFEEFYDRRAVLDETQATLRKQGKPIPQALGQEAYEFAIVSGAISELRKLQNASKSQAERDEISAYQVGMARWVLGKPELQTMPNLLAIPVAPVGMEAVRSDVLGRLALMATSKQENRGHAFLMLRRLDVDPRAVFDEMRAEAIGRHLKTTTPEYRARESWLRKIAD